MHLTQPPPWPICFRRIGGSVAPLVVFLMVFLCCPVRAFNSSASDTATITFLGEPTLSNQPVEVDFAGERHTYHLPEFVAVPAIKSYSLKTRGRISSLLIKFPLLKMEKSLEIDSAKGSNLYVSLDHHTLTVDQTLKPESFD